MLSVNDNSEVELSNEASLLKFTYGCVLIPNISQGLTKSALHRFSHANLQYKQDVPILLIDIY